MKEGFYKGARVVITSNATGLPFFKGELATVLADTKPGYLIPVRFDICRRDRHDCNGLCESGHGFYMYPAQLELHQEEELIPWSDGDWNIIFGEMNLLEVCAS